MRSPPRSSPPARTAKFFSTSATAPATTRSRAFAWPTSSSSRAPWPPSKARSFPAQTFAADPALFLTDAPLAVLVNRGTYGAAELTAAAIQDAKRGDLVGERTFGEGSVQKTIDLPDGAALLLTVAKYESPAGKRSRTKPSPPPSPSASPKTKTTRRLPPKATSRSTKPSSS